jgi:hypothetical protein
MPRLASSRVSVLLLLGALLGAAGAGLIRLGIEERVGVLLDLGVGLAGGGVACLVIGIARGLWGLFVRARDLGVREYREHRGFLQPLLVATALVVALLAALLGHNYVVWAAIERDCEQALNTDDRVEAQWALTRGLTAMRNPLLLIPSDLLDLWGPNRCRAAIERHQLVPGDSAPAGFLQPAPSAAADAGRPGRPQLLKYSLRDQGYTDQELLTWLAELETDNRLISLVLEGNQLTAVSLQAVAESGIGVIHTLLVGRNPIGDAGAEVLATGAAFSALRILYMPQTGLTAVGLRHLFGPDSELELLADLDLSGNRLGDEGAQILAGSRRAEGLTHLYLDNTGLTDGGALALAESPHLGALEYLSLDGNDLTGAGVSRAREIGSLPAATEIFFGEQFE